MCVQFQIKAKFMYIWGSVQICGDGMRIQFSWQSDKHAHLLPLSSQLLLPCFQQIQSPPPIRTDAYSIWEILRSSAVKILFWTLQLLDKPSVHKDESRFRCNENRIKRLLDYVPDCPQKQLRCKRPFLFSLTTDWTVWS